MTQNPRFHWNHSCVLFLLGTGWKGKAGEISEMVPFVGALYRAGLRLTRIVAAACTSAHPLGPQPAGPSARHRRGKVRGQEQGNTNAPTPQCFEPRSAAVVGLFGT